MDTVETPPPPPLGERLRARWPEPLIEGASITLAVLLALVIDVGQARRQRIALAEAAIDAIDAARAANGGEALAARSETRG